eukprot:COSAG05_NODE_14729_length_389_cov_0.534483_2_plen_99_part_00
MSAKEKKLAKVLARKERRQRSHSIVMKAVGSQLNSQLAANNHQRAMMGVHAPRHQRAEELDQGPSPSPFLEDTVPDSELELRQFLIKWRLVPFEQQMR